MRLMPLYLVAAGMALIMLGLFLPCLLGVAP